MDRIAASGSSSIAGRAPRIEDPLEKPKRITEMLRVTKVSSITREIAK